MKKFGLHHLVAAVPVFGILLLLFHFIPPQYAAAVAHALFWFGKEFGEAVERAGGTRQAIHTLTMKTGNNPGGIWEPFDFITPSVAGFIVAGAI